MKQSTTRKSLRDHADRLFSEYIRRKYATSTGWVDCKCGCGVNDKWKNMQCSHYVARHNDSVRWDERNAVPAFRICNYYDQDHQKKIAIFINRKFGEGTTDELERLGKQTVKLMPFEIQEIIDDLKKKINAL